MIAERIERAMERVLRRVLDLPASDEPVCQIAGRPCPRTSDPRARHFCPLWAEQPQEWENVRTGEKIYEHCGARMLWLGTRDAVMSARSSAAASESLRNVIARLTGRVRSRDPAPIDSRPADQQRISSQ